MPESDGLPKHESAMRNTTTPPWKKPTPKGQKPHPLSAAQKDAARQRAEENGRAYPNLVDNMWAKKLPRGD